MHNTAYSFVIFASIILVAAFLLFFRLDNRPLWQDEAETACLGQNVLAKGLPYVDGPNGHVSQEEDREFGEDRLWRWSPWLQIYMSAAGQWIKAKDTFTARLPFAIVGLICIAVVYLLVRRHFDNIPWAALSASFLTLCIPFIIFARQGRYYGASALIVSLFLWAFLGDWRKKWGPLVGMSVCLGLLFHANYLILLSFAPAVLLSALLVYKKDIPLKRVLWVVLFTSIIVLPGLFFYVIGKQAGMVTASEMTFRFFWGNFFMFFLPLPVFVLLLWRFRRFFMKLAVPEDPAEKLILFLLLVCSFNVMAFCVVPQHFHRYLVHLYPLCAIILGWCAVKLWYFSKSSAVLFSCLIALTNWLYIVPMEVTSLNIRHSINSYANLNAVNIPLKLYLTELVCGFPDVNAHLLDFFKKNAKKGDTLLAVEYSDLPLMFYTDLKIQGGLARLGPVPETKPKWVLLRYHALKNRDGLYSEPRKFMERELDLANDYERIELPYNDDLFGNRADPFQHNFLPREEVLKPLTIYRRKGI